MSNGSATGRRVVEVGASLVLDIGPVAHGGHCVARHEGQVVFVRHTLPGERVRAVVTSRTSKFLRADAVDIVKPARGRVTPPCDYARPGGCGGCDWQHADLVTQRAMKAVVVAEQLLRLARIDLDVVVEEVAGAPDGLRWRTRERFSVDEATGRIGLHAFRSHEVIPLDDCPIAHETVIASGVLGRNWSGTREVRVAASPTTGDLAVVGDGSDGPGQAIRERAAGREWRVAADGFWQVHPGAADALASAVLQSLQPVSGEHAVDLYAGVGLYTGPLAEAVGVGGRVDAVEGSGRAIRDARHNLADLAWVRLHRSEVAGWLRMGAVRRADLIVLDPPRAGAGKDVVRSITRLRPRAITYVACDPAALARDLATFADLGWELSRLRAFDIFPMTHHVECVATLRPTQS